MHRSAVGHVINGGCNCRRAKMFCMPQPGIQPKSQNLEANTLPRRFKSQLLSQGSRSVFVFTLTL